MVRRPKPPHLYFRPAKYVKGKLRARAVWCIVDGGQEKSTGFGIEQRAEAEQALAQYLDDKHEPSRRKGQSIDDILIADVCAIYLRDRVPEQKRPEKTAERFIQLLEWWGDKVLGEINGRSCRDYVEWRCSHAWKSAKPDVTGKPPRMVTSSGARRELEDLRAAVNYHQNEGYHREIVKVTLPPKGRARHRYLRRSELAKMVWIAWRRREDAKVVQGPRKGQRTQSSRRPSRHIARFLLVGAYTGTRAAAIGSAAFAPTPGHGWVDLKSGLFYRAEEGAKETNKRQPTILLPRRLLMHMRRWKKANPKQKFVVEWNGKPVREVNNGFGKIVELAGLGPEVIPHTLRHTCATWLSQRGASMADAAGYLGMSQEVFERVYRHHSPTLRIAGFVNPPIFDIFDPKYHPAEIILDDGWVEGEAA